LTGAFDWLKNCFLLYDRRRWIALEGISRSVRRRALNGAATSGLAYPQTPVDFVVNAQRKQNVRS